MVGKEYITGFLVFLQEQYGLPFQIEHKVMAKGGKTMMADGGTTMAKRSKSKRSKYTWDPEEDKMTGERDGERRAGMDEDDYKTRKAPFSFKPYGETKGNFKITCSAGVRGQRRPSQFKRDCHFSLTQTTGLPSPRSKPDKLKYKIFSLKN
jgi:hypothetical protein